jgi:hypothetical protein
MLIDCLKMYKAVAGAESVGLGADGGDDSADFVLFKLPRACFGVCVLCVN